jgi:hypothetical protein
VKRTRGIGETRPLTRSHASAPEDFRGLISHPIYNATMGKMKDLAGYTFDRLTAIQYLGPHPKSRASLWLCRCACGNEITVPSTALAFGNTKSCGCLQKEKASAKALRENFRHGLSHTPEWYSWQSMIQRCTNPKHRTYRYWGGRGITVCAEWRYSFPAFLANMGPRPSSKHTLDRINNDGNYAPGNCRWATAKEQISNRRPRQFWVGRGSVSHPPTIEVPREHPPS